MTDDIKERFDKNEKYVVTGFNELKRLIVEIKDITTQTNLDLAKISIIVKGNGTEGHEQKINKIFDKIDDIEKEINLITAIGKTSSSNKKEIETIKKSIIKITEYIDRSKGATKIIAFIISAIGIWNIISLFLR